MTSDKAVMDKFKEIAEAEPRVDIVRFRAGDRKMDVLISVFNEGYERVIDKDDTSNFIGVKYNPDAQDGIRVVFERIKKKLAEASIPISTEEYVSYPRLPIDDESFRKEFVNPVDLSITNELVLQKRLTGLISYYKGSKVEYMPRVAKDESVKCEMSDYVLSKYTTERIREISGEVKKDKEKGDAFADVEVYAKMKNPSSYRFRSRALCNFVFPKSITRPFPDSAIEEEEETALVEDLEMAEALTDVDEDLAAEEFVARENESIPDPEDEDEEEEEEEKKEDDEEEDDNSNSIPSIPPESDNESDLESDLESVASNLSNEDEEGEEDKERAEALGRIIKRTAIKGGGKNNGTEKPATTTITSKIRRRPVIVENTPTTGVAESKEEPILDTVASAATTVTTAITDSIKEAAATVTATPVRRVRPKPVIVENEEEKEEKESVAEAVVEAEQVAIIGQHRQQPPDALGSDS